jgi:hypothetical protein
MAIWNILRLFSTFYGHFGNLVAIWYIFPRFGVLCQEKSGNTKTEDSSENAFLGKEQLPPKIGSFIKYPRVKRTRTIHPRANPTTLFLQLQRQRSVVVG